MKGFSRDGDSCRVRRGCRTALNVSELRFIAILFDFVIEHGSKRKLRSEYSRACSSILSVAIGFRWSEQA